RGGAARGPTRASPISAAAACASSPATAPATARSGPHVPSRRSGGRSPTSSRIARGPQLELRIPGVRALAFAADGRLALLRSREIVVVSGGEAQTAFEWRTPLAGLAWSPDGSWLATAIPAADQLVFVGRRGVRAVGNAARQFGGAVSLDGWVGAP